MSLPTPSAQVLRLVRGQPGGQESRSQGRQGLSPVLMPARRTLCESEYPGRVAHSYRSNRIFRKTLASHFGNDVLENVAVAVPAIFHKPVFREDVLTDDDSVGIAGVGDALYEIQPLGVAGHVDFGQRIVRPLIAEQVPFKITA